MRRPSGLLVESDAWLRDGVITADQRRAILARYEAAGTQQAAALLRWLAVIVAGIGAIVLVAWNWASIPATAKVLLAAGPMIALYVAAAIAARSSPGRSEGLAVVAALFAGGVLFVTDDLVHVDSAHTGTMLLWAALLAVTAVLTPSAIAAGLGTLVSAWWLLMHGGVPPAPWALLFVWAALAGTVERVANRWTAAAVGFLFGAWVFFVVLAVWRDQVALPAVAAVLAGNWMYTLSLLASPPAFARATPALVVTLLGLAFLLPSASHHGMPDWRLASDSIAPAVSLLLALAAATGWNLARSDGGRSRPAVLTVVVMSWLVTCFLLPAPLRTSPALQWTWTALFSAMMAHLGATTVRDGIRFRDFGQLAVGLLAIVSFVVTRVADARSLVVSGVMLIAAALLLLWLARLAPGSISLPPPSALRPPSSARRSARGIVVAAAIAVFTTGVSAAYRTWPAVKGLEVRLPATLDRQGMAPGYARVRLPYERIALDVPHGSAPMTEAYAPVRRVGDWWTAGGDARTNARRLRGRQLYLQLVPTGAEVRASTVSNAPVPGVINLAGVVASVREDGYLTLDFGFAPIPASAAASAPGTAVLRVLPSGRATLAGVTAAVQAPNR